jgi:hypothetical protein
MVDPMIRATKNTEKFNKMDLNKSASFFRKAPMNTKIAVIDTIRNNSKWMISVNIIISFCLTSILPNIDAD